MRRLWLACGIPVPFLFASAEALAGLRWPEYSFRDQTISELAAIGAPPRPLFTALLIVTDLLLVAFGAGVWQWGAGRHRIRVAGVLLITFGVLAVTVGPFVSMRPRGADQGLAGTLHLAEGLVAMVILLLAMGFAASDLGGRFRWYTIATIAVVVGFGAWSGLDAPRIEAGLSTPWVGVKERIAWYAYYLWFPAFAVVLLRERHRRTAATSG